MVRGNGTAVTEIVSIGIDRRLWQRFKRIAKRAKAEPRALAVDTLRRFVLDVELDEAIERELRAMGS